MNEFAVDQRRVDRQLAEAIRERREFGGPIETAASDQPDLAVLDAGEQAVSVVFDLMQPFVSLGRLVRERGELRLDILEHGTSASPGEALKRNSPYWRLFVVVPLRVPDPFANRGHPVEPEAPGHAAMVVPDARPP